MINIKKVLSDNHIDFVEHSSNTKKGEISIACPLCGPADPSQHMGINPITGYWACWRSKKHSGKNIARLLALLNIYISEYRNEVMQQLINKTYFNSSVKIEDKPYTKVTKLPIGFVPLDDDTVLSKPYLNYLRKRGFSDPLQVVKDYDLRRSIMADKWSARIIIPIWVGEEVCWTGRAIGSSSLRYLSPKEGETISIKSTIANYNDLLKSEGKAILIGEGPFDFLVGDYLLKPDIRATCLFNTSASDIQLKLLYNICPNYNNVLICLDESTLPQALLLARQLERFSPHIVKLEKKDLGEMNQQELKYLMEKYI